MKGKINIQKITLIIT